MAGKPWTADEDAQVDAWLAEGGDPYGIAQKLGRSGHAVVRRLQARGEKAKAPVAIEPEERQALEDSSAHSRIQQLEQKLAALTTGLNNKENRLPVETHAEPPTDPADVWAQCEVDSARRIKFYHERSRFRVDLSQTDPDLPVGVSFVSDQHISPGNVIDFRRMREDAELIAATPGLYACLGGDGVDNHIKIRPASLAARSQPSEQYKLFDFYLGIFAQKIMALTSGNHDAWTDQIAGIDMIQELAHRQRLCYCPAEAHIEATLSGDVTYKLTVRHQYRFNSSMNQGHAPKQLWRFGEESFDIGVVCHHHEPHIESFEAHSQTRWVGRPGSYQIGSSYSRQYGFNETMPTCPTFVLYPGTRDIVGFRNVHHAARFLKSERGGK